MVDVSSHKPTLRLQRPSVWAPRTFFHSSLEPCKMARDRHRPSHVVHVALYCVLPPRVFKHSKSMGDLDCEARALVAVLGPTRQPFPGI